MSRGICVGGEVSCARLFLPGTAETVIDCDEMVPRIATSIILSGASDPGVVSWRVALIRGACSLNVGAMDPRWRSRVDRRRQPSTCGGGSARFLAPRQRVYPPVRQFGLSGRSVQLSEAEPRSNRAVLCQKAPFQRIGIREFRAT